MHIDAVNVTADVVPDQDRLRKPAHELPQRLRLCRIRIDTGDQFFVCFSQACLGKMNRVFQIYMSKMRGEKTNRPVELASAISGRPSAVAVTSQSTVAVLLALALALALSFEPGSVIE